MLLTFRYTFFLFHCDRLTNDILYIAIRWATWPSTAQEPYAMGVLFDTFVSFQFMQYTKLQYRAHALYYILHTLHVWSMIIAVYHERFAADYNRYVLHIAYYVLRIAITYCVTYCVLRITFFVDHYVIYIGGGVFLHIRGLPMGQIVSPVLADALLHTCDTYFFLVVLRLVPDFLCLWTCQWSRQFSKPVISSTLFQRSPSMTYMASVMGGRCHTFAYGKQ